jgi:hypothetical protein
VTSFIPTHDAGQGSSHGSGASEWSVSDNSPLCPTSDSYFAGRRVNKQFRRNAGPSKSVLLIHTGEIMIKMLVATAATVGMVSAAFAADLPRRQPPPPVAPMAVGKAPIGKGPIGKAPMGKYPQPVYTKG